MKVAKRVGVEYWVVSRPPIAIGTPRVVDQMIEAQAVLFEQAPGVFPSSGELQWRLPRFGVPRNRMMG
jgi:hypothetical protein